MALSVKAGHFNTGAVIGNVAITGLGFQPTAIVFLGLGSGAVNTDNTRQYGGIGFASSSGNQSAMGLFSQGGVPTSNTKSMVSGSSIYLGLDTGGLRQRVSLVSMDADGFTVSTQFSGEDHFVSFLAFGGVQAKAGLLGLTAGVGSNSISGVGGVPDVVFLASAGQQGADNELLDGNTSFWGVYDGTNSYQASWYRQDNVGRLQNRGGNEQFTYPILMQDFDGTTQCSAEIEMTATGFKANKVVAPTGTQLIPYIAIKGVKTYLNSFLADEAFLATKAITGVGFQPEGSLFMTDYLNGPITSGAFGNRFYIGYQAGTPAEGTGGPQRNAYCHSWSGADEFASPSEIEDRSRMDASGLAMNIMNTTEKVEHFNVDSFDVDGFTIRNFDKSTVNFGPSDIYYLAFVEGSNNNQVLGSSSCERGKRTQSNFGMLTSEYGRFADTVSHPDATCFNACVKAANSATNQAIIEYDLGPDYLDDFEIADTLAIENFINYVYLEDPVTLRVRASDDPFFLTFEEDVFSVSSSDLVGKENRDYVTDLDFSTARRYWRIYIETTGSYYPTIGAIHLGKALRFERCPAYPSNWKLVDNLTESQRNPWEVKLIWEGLTEVDKEAFSTFVAEHSDVVPIFLYDGADSVLYNYKVFRVFIRDYNFKGRRGGNDWQLTVTFEELL